MATVSSCDIRELLASVDTDPGPGLIRATTNPSDEVEQGDAGRPLVAALDFTRYRLEGYERFVDETIGSHHRLQLEPVERPTEQKPIPRWKVPTYVSAIHRAMVDAYEDAEPSTSWLACPRAGATPSERR